MAYNSIHTGPEIDAAVTLLGDIQDARDATAADRQVVETLAPQVEANAQTAANAVATTTADRIAAQQAAIQAQASATEVSGNTTEAQQAAQQATDMQQLAEEAAQTAMLDAATASQRAIETEQYADQVAQDAVISQQARDEAVQSAAGLADAVQSAAADAARAKSSADTAAAVATGGTASLTPAPGKIPLADGKGHIDRGWLANNMAAAAPPTNTDDSTKGYGPLSEWIVPSTGEIWQCVSAAPGAAVWQRPAAMVRSDNVDPLVIGVRRPTSDSAPHQWQRIREDGSLFTDDARVFFANHPTYAGIHTVIIDGQFMVHLPKYWIKTVDLPGGGIEYYISPTPKPGYVVHQAYFDQGNELNQFWMGAYHASEDAANAGMLASQPNVLPRVSLSGAAAISQMEARNRDGIAGFGSMTWAQICAVKLLILIECGSPDVRTLIGEGWNGVTAGEIKPTGTSNANWRGIYDVWGLVHTLADGIEIVGPRVWMRGIDGEMADTGHDVPASGYINTTAGGDLAWAFLPAATGGSTTGYLSYQWANNDTTTAVRHGGAFYSAAARVGLWSIAGSATLANANTDYGFRLAKV